MAEVLSITGSVASLLAFAGSVVMWLRSRLAAREAEASAAAARSAREQSLRLAELIKLLTLLDEAASAARLAWESCRGGTAGGYAEASRLCGRLGELTAGLEVVAVAAAVVAGPETARAREDLRAAADLLSTVGREREAFETTPVASLGGRTPKQECLRRLQAVRDELSFQTEMTRRGLVDRGTRPGRV